MSFSVKITPIVENQSKLSNLLPEHGLSLLIECDGKRILFDTGAGDLVLSNAKELSIDLGAVDCIVLSHGHYDHTNGLQYMNNKKVYAHPDVFVPKYETINGRYEYVGFSHSKEHYETANNLEFIQVEQGIKLTENINLHTNFKKQEIKDFYLQTNTGYIQDAFNDELVLSINTDDGLVIISGCAHSGIVNIFDKVMADSGNKSIYAVFGGFHLYDLDHEEIKLAADAINNYNINTIGISHCTGDKLMKYLDNPKVFNFNIGDSFVC